MNCNAYEIFIEFERKRKLHRKYNKISFETKMQIVNLVQNQQLSVNQVSRQLKIKTCTSKKIISKYKKEGDVFKKNKRRIKIEICYQIRLKIIHPLTLKEHENLNTLSYNMFINQGNLNNVKQSLEVQIVQGLQEYVSNLTGLEQTKIQQQNISFIQEYLNTQLIYTNIRQSILSFNNKICELLLFLKNNDQLLEIQDQENNKSARVNLFALLEKNKDIQDQKSIDQLLLFQNQNQIQAILEQSANNMKNKYNNQNNILHAKMLYFLTQECIIENYNKKYCYFFSFNTLSNKYALYNNNFLQINMMAKAIKSILQNSIF